MTIVNAALSLGSAVHDTLENLKHLPVAQRMARDLSADFERSWNAVSGKRGGFTNDAEEAEAKARGRTMIERVIAHPGPIGRKTVALRESHNGMPSNFYLSEDENIILCGLIDWIEYVEADDTVKILDFKTGKHEESDDSLQLPIYLLLLNNLQKRVVSGASYWYLEKEDAPRTVQLPEAEDAFESVLAIARRVKKARQTGEFPCRRGEAGCFACTPLEKILAGEAEPIGVIGRSDAYIV